jgi:hypothetical protein
VIEDTTYNLEAEIVLEMPMLMPRRKIGACVPCHTRKVACDAQRIGTPCSRCTQKCITGLCMPAARSTTECAPQLILIRRPLTYDFSAKRLHQQNSILTSDLEPNQQVSTEITPNDSAFEKPLVIMVEHYNNYNPYVLLGEALGQTRRPGLVLPEYPNDMLAMERELSLLDGTDKEYIRQKRVYDMPAKQTW